MPTFTPYIWSYRNDTLRSNSTIYIRYRGRYVTGEYLKSISYDVGKYLTITGRDAPAAYYINNSNQRSNIRFNTPWKGQIIFDSSITGDTLTLFSDDVGISNITLTGSANINADVSLSLSNINLNGNIGNNRLVGNAYNNIIDGKGTLSGGSDVMIGGAGDDTYYVYSLDDVVIENFGEGTDTIKLYGSYRKLLGTYTLPNNVENIDVSYTFQVIGNSSNNIIRAMSGVPFLDGGEGADILIGSPYMNTTYTVDNVNDVVIPTDESSSVQTVRSSVNWTLGNYLQHLTLIGTSDINGTGNSRDNTIIGNSGDNIINGNAGNDIITGGLGWDTMDGGLGVDTFVFKNGDSTIKSTGTLKFDTITGLEVAVDIIDGNGNRTRTPINVGELMLPNNSFNYYNIANALNTKFIQNETILFTYNQRTFLGIDDGTAGFNNNTDSVIEITGYSGNLPNLRVV